MTSKSNLIKRNIGANIVFIVCTLIAFCIIYSVGAIELIIIPIIAFIAGLCLLYYDIRRLKRDLDEN